MGKGFRRQTNPLSPFSHHRDFPKTHDLGNRKFSTEHCKAKTKEILARPKLVAESYHHSFMVVSLKSNFGITMIEIRGPIQAAVILRIQDPVRVNGAQVMNRVVAYFLIADLPWLLACFIPSRFLADTDTTSSHTPPYFDLCLTS